MLIHWQSHQEYLHFLHETKVHLDSSQRTRLHFEFFDTWQKLRMPDSDPSMDFLPGFYSALGRPAKNQLPNRHPGITRKLAFPQRQAHTRGRRYSFR